MKGKGNEFLLTAGALAAQAGVELTEEALTMAPRLDLGRTPHEIALTLGRVCATRDIYLRGDAIVTVDLRTGEERAMEPKRFCSWVDQLMVFSDRGNPSSLRGEQAAIVLAADGFRGMLRKLYGVHLVRLPVRRASGEVEFLPVGYDAETGIITVETLSYDLEKPFTEALEEWKGLHAGYPWAEIDAEPDLLKNRSFAVHTANFVGEYVRAFFAPGTPRPMWVYLGNQPGTGKSTLGVMNLAGPHGAVGMAPAPKNSKDMESLLDTTAASGQPFLFLDDVGGGLYSPALNKFMTATRHAVRLFGQNTQLTKFPNVTQVVATGNGITLTPDLLRRSLVVELFLGGEVRGRKFAQRLSPAGIQRPAMRERLLAIAAAFVRRWCEMDCPLHQTPLESFEEWTEVAGGVVQAIGMSDPMQTPELPMGGDEEGEQMRAVLIALASGVIDPQDEEERTIHRTHFTDKARELGVMQDVVGSSGDLNTAQLSMLGKRLRKWRGRELVDDKGRRFRFGRRHQKNGNVYPIDYIA